LSYRKTADSSGPASVAVDLSKELSSRLDVGGPAKPASVASIHVHGNVRKIELFEGIDSKLLVSGGSVRALLDVHVGDHVGQGIRFNDQNSADIGVLDKELTDPVDVALVVVGTIVGDRPLAVRSSSRAITVW